MLQLDKKMRTELGFTRGITPEAILYQLETYRAVD